MKIRKMTAWFGALDGGTLEPGDGLNIIVAPNESGKSTWCAFLRTMLYGLDTSQRARAGQKPDKVKYRPWGGASMSGSLEAETPEGRIVLRRWTEREDRPMQAFSATVPGTDLPVPGFTAENAGERLLGVSRAVFERSAFIRQSGMELENDPELDRRIRSIVASGDEDVSYLEAEKRLKDWQRRRSGKRGAIPELQAAMEEDRRTLTELRRLAQTAAEAEEELRGLEARRAAAELRMTQARTKQRKRALADLAAARLRVQEAEETRRQAENALRRAEEALVKTPFAGAEAEEAERQAEADLQKAGELQASAERTPSARRALWLLIPAAAALLLSLFLPWTVPLRLSGAALLLLAGAWFATLRRGQLTGLRLLEERAAILARYGAESPDEIRTALVAYCELWEEKGRASRRRDEAEAASEGARASQQETEARAMNELDFVNGDNEAVRAGREEERLRTQIAAAKERRARAEGQAKALGDVPVLESGLAEAERRCAALLRQGEALSLAEEAMSRADGELQQRLSPRIAKRSAEYFSFLTDGRYDELTLSRDLAARARPAGDAVGREADYLSAGARDQLYFALRLALCDMVLPEDDPGPLVLDDALVAFDGERMARALELLRRIAEKRQILLFTCHTRERDFFAADPAVTKIAVSAK